MLVDAGWDQVSSFSRWSPLRSDDVASVHRFYVGLSVARPITDSVLTAAEAWIHETMDDETAGDYVTGHNAWEDAAEHVGPSIPHHAWSKRMPSSRCSSALWGWKLD